MLGALISIFFLYTAEQKIKMQSWTCKNILNVTLFCLLLRNNYVGSITGKGNDISSPPRLDRNSGPLRSLSKACRAHFPHRNHAYS